MESIYSIGRFVLIFRLAKEITRDTQDVAMMIIIVQVVADHVQEQDQDHQVEMVDINKKKKFSLFSCL